MSTFKEQYEASIKPPPKDVCTACNTKIQSYHVDVQVGQWQFQHVDCFTKGARDG